MNNCEWNDVVDLLLNTCDLVRELLLDAKEFSKSVSTFGMTESQENAYRSMVVCIERALRIIPRPDDEE